jgi:type IV pilus assembly protein PilW
VNPRINRTGPLAHQHGVGLVEAMIGILIGMVVIVVIFSILSVAEGYRRSTTGTADAQITGLLSEFVAGRDAGNGGAGIAMSNADMITCTRNEGNAPVTALGYNVESLEVAIRPVPLLITDSGDPGLSDSFISYSAGSSHVMWPVDFHGPPNTVNAGSSIIVQSPNGYTVPVPTAAAPYWAVVMSNDDPLAKNNRCKLIRIVNAVPDPVASKTGFVTLTQDPLLKTSVAYPVSTTWGATRLFNLGPQGSATRIRYGVDDATGVLQTRDLLVVPPAVPTWTPVAQNVVLMKVQYGIDDNLDGVVDCWTSAANVACGDYSEATVLNAPLTSTVANTPALNKILAVRIGVVVRSDEPDLRLLTDPSNTALQAEARGVLQGTRPPTVLFNCSANDGTCQGRIVVPEGGTATGTPTCGAGKVICDYWRYRTYETVIPLRNAVYSASIPP